MLSIPNYCRRNANQNDKKWNPTSQNGHSHKSTNGICGRERGRMGNPSHGQRKECCQQTLELTVFARQTKKKKKKKKINRANPRIWHPHISVYILRKPPFKKSQYFKVSWNVSKLTLFHPWTPHSHHSISIFHLSFIDIKFTVSLRSAHICRQCY